MSVIEYPPKSLSKLTRKQLETVAIALEEQRDRAIARVDKASSLIRDLTDPEPCHFDHHGGCQAHGYLSLEPGEKCPQQQAKEWTKSLEGKA
jgi:hypothetical protein